MVATSSNHSEILALNEASRKWVWLRSMIEHIYHTCQMSYLADLFTKSFPTSVFDRFVSLIGMHRLKVLYSLVGVN